jgi:molybdenum cofactor biosynthesis enzyme MoaA
MAHPFQLTQPLPVYLRIILTRRCNNRCVYCFGEAGEPEGGELFGPHFFRELGRVADRQHIRKIHFSGGEPLMDPSIADHILEVTRNSHSRVGVTTNGTLLHLHAKRLLQAGLSGINISLPTLRPERYRSICGRDALDTVLSNIDLALEMGFRPVKINIPVYKNNSDELMSFMEYFLPKHGIDLRFFSLLPNSGVKDSGVLDHDHIACHLDNAVECLEGSLHKEALARVYLRPSGRPAFKVCRNCDFWQFCVDQAKAIRLWRNGDVRLCLHNPFHAEHIEHPEDIDTVISRMMALCQ